MLGTLEQTQDGLPQLRFTRMLEHPVEKVWRAINFFEGDKVNERALKNLARAAVDFNQIKLKRKAPVQTSRKRPMVKK